MRLKSRVVSAAVTLLGFARLSLTDSDSSSSSSACEWDSGMGATFDLSRLQLNHGGQLSYYTVRDSRADTNTNYNFSYNFNICNQVLNYPSYSSACKGSEHETCTATFSNGSCKTREIIDGKAFAYQLNNKHRDKCFVIGGTDLSTQMNYSLLSKVNPASGLNLIYTDGEWCEKETIQRNREFHLNFLCDDDSYNIPDEERVREDEHCVYSIMVKSVYGCPTECGVFSNSLCGANGLCDYDWTNGKARCFCYFGWSGNDCTLESLDESEYSDNRKHEEEDEVWVTTYDRTVTYKDQNGISKSATVQVTYDLGNFHFDSGTNQFQLTSEDGQYLYYFNLFGNVNAADMPDVCADAIGPCDSDSIEEDTCDTTVSSVGENKEGSIFQIGNDTDGNLDCQLLGTWNSDDANSAFMQELENPTGGVKVIYTSGGYCKDPNRNRQMQFTFICPDSNRVWIDNTEDREIKAYVSEDETCQYTTVIETAFACPWQCIAEDSQDKDKFTVCGGRGMCAADPFAGTVRCLCDAGYTGTYCTEEESTSTGGGSNHKDSDVGWKVAISVISVLVAVFIAATLWLYRQNRELSQFQSQFLEDEPDDVLNPHHHSEPKVPDDMVDSDSGGDLESISNERGMTTMTGAGGGFGDTVAEEVQIEMNDGFGQVMPNSPLRNEDSYEKEELVN